MIEISARKDVDLDIDFLRDVCEKFLESRKIEKDVSIAFVASEEMAKINKKYRNINKTTDVLAFEGEGDFLGEILLDLDQIKKQAKTENKEEKDELIFVLVHGLLHLVGMKDEDEEERTEMIRQGEKFIDSL